MPSCTVKEFRKIKSLIQRIKPKRKVLGEVRTCTVEPWPDERDGLKFSPFVMRTMRARPRSTQKKD